MQVVAPSKTAEDSPVGAATRSVRFASAPLPVSLFLTCHSPTHPPVNLQGADLRGI